MVRLACTIIGCMRLPVIDNEFSNVDKDAVSEMFDYFIANGFSYVDTAWFYHNENSERAIKECLVERYPRESFQLADKMPVVLLNTEKRFMKLTDAMEKEQENNQNRMQEIAALISEEEHSEGDVQMFMGEIRRYAAITELDETVLNRLINRILIGEPKKVDGVRTQEVRIVYNFVGEL